MSSSVDEIFSAALDENPENRAALLDRMCDGDLGLRARVERLLACHDRAPGFLEQPAEPAGAGPATFSFPRSAAVEAALPAGTLLGRYRIVHEIGAGGMGTVYEAEQEHPRRSVALKVIRPGAISRSARRRFEIEVEVLGRLQHPGIAQIYEAGVAEMTAGPRIPSRTQLLGESIPPANEGTEKGFSVQQVPFFAMELVRGPALLEFARRRELSTRDKLELFAKVCDAVEHAHQKGVIHRDLKPANILVLDECGVRSAECGINNAPPTPGGTDQSPLTTHPSRARQDACPTAQPKILDFGIARATDCDVTATQETAVGQIVGTIAYMSPEQVGGDPAQIDTRSDVYSLGVVLFELLSGRRPYDVDNRSLPEALRVVREEDPTHLSSIHAAFRGDLTTIATKALEKDSTRRYQSASEFAADVRHYLRDEPIVARPTTGMYQLRKFARRHKGLVAGLAATVLALILGIAGTTGGMLWAMREQTRAERSARAEIEQRQLAQVSAQEATDEAARAERERDDKQVVIDLMREMLGAADPRGLKDRDYTVRALLDDFDTRFKTHPIDRPDVEAVIRATLGEAYSGLGEYERAVQHLKTALDIRRRVLGDETSAELAALMLDLSAAQRLTGQYQEAESLARSQLELQRRRLGDDHPDVAASLDNLGWVLWPAGKREDSAASFSAALEMQRRLLGEDHPRTADIMSGFALLLMRMGKPAEAEPLAKKAVDVHAGLFGEKAPAYLYSLSIYAGSLHDQGRFDEAEPLYRKVIETERQVLGVEHPEVAVILHSLSILVRDTGRPAEAEPLARECLRIREKKLDANHPDIINIKVQLAIVLLDLGQYEDAEALARECVAAPTASPGMFKSFRGRFHEMNLLGGALVGQGAKLAASDPVAAAAKFAEAEPMLISGHDGMHIGDENVITRRRNRDALERVMRLYEAWDVVQPDAGHDANAEEWRAKLEAWQATTQPAAGLPGTL